MKKVISLTVFLTLCICLFANTDKYRLVINDDPSSTITIGWNQISGENPVVYYDVVDHGMDISAYSKTQSVDRQNTHKSMNNRFVDLRGLVANTIYYFVIADSESISDRFWFRTAPDDNSRLSFIAGGDSRNNRSPRRKANLLVSKLKPHAVLFGGDMTDDDTDEEWSVWLDDWQETISPDGRMYPILPARGNHDSQSTVHNLFGIDEREYYAVTFGDDFLRFYSLNTEISVLGNQLDWLVNDLDNNTNAKWKIAQYHKPMRPHTSAKSEGNAEYNAWAQLFYDHQVNLVVDCDSHMNKTTWPVKPSNAVGSDEGFIRDDLKGTVYTGEGCWGAPLRAADDDKEWTRNSGSFNQFKLIFVDSVKMELRTIIVENAAQVAEGSNTDPFTLPQDLNVWEPSNGAVVEIFDIEESPNIDIEFTAPDNSVYPTAVDIELAVNVLNEGAGVRDVKFYVDGNLALTDDTPPFSFTESYPNGRWTIEALATDIDGQTDVDQIDVLVGSFSETIGFKIENGDNDVEETQAGVLSFSSSDLELVYDSHDIVSGIPNGFQTVGLRFQDINIPKGSVINRAYIQFRSDEVNSQAARVRIRVEDTNDSTPFDESEAFNISSRPKLNESVIWEPVAFTASGQVSEGQQTPELRSMIQPIIDKDQWNTGNAILLTIEGDGVSASDPDSKRVVDSSEGSSDFAPTLVVDYTFTQNVSNSFVVDGCKNAIYPNPFKDVINIESDCNVELKVQLYDVMGRKVVLDQTYDPTGKIQISSEALNAGIYILSAQNAEGEYLFIRKVLKE